jgi:thioredoxin 1
MVRPVRIFAQTAFWALGGLALVLPGCSPASNKTVALSASNFEDVVLAKKGLVLVDFWDDGCPPCRAMDPVIRSLAVDFEGKAVVGKLHIGDHPEIARKYGIQVVPTFVVFKGGEVVRRIEGAAPKQYLRDLLGALQ